jgi:cytochrome b6-f complex iron-sulfur subunit
MPLGRSPATPDTRETDDARWARATGAAPVPVVPRRRFVRGAGLAAAGAAVGAAVTAFVGRSDGDASAGRFDGLVALPPVADLVSAAAGAGDPAWDGPVFLDEHRVYVVPFPVEAVPEALTVYDERLHDGLRVGVVVLDARCTHLGCHVPWCASSWWFECPCHAAMFDAVGEVRGGPAPRGLDHRAVVLGADGVARFDPALVIPGPAQGTATTDATEPAGPFCSSVTVG